MLLNYFILAISLSLDSLGIGITYGLRKTTISKFSKIILFCMSLFITFISINIGNLLNKVLSSSVSNFLGIVILIAMGIWVIHQSLNKDVKLRKENKKKVYNFFIKSLGLTIKIIRNPIETDIDNSKTIDAKEALLLGLATSMDSMCSGIGISILGTNSILFPILVASFQMLFISVGGFFGKKLMLISKLPSNIWSIISGVVLILIAISRIFL